MNRQAFKKRKFDERTANRANNFDELFKTKRGKYSNEFLTKEQEIIMIKKRFAHKIENILGP